MTQESGAPQGTTTRPVRLVYVVTEDWYFCSHRLPIARAAKREGYDVHVITQVGAKKSAILCEGFTIHPIKLRRASLNPLRELLVVLQIAQIFIRLRPDLIHNVALKPVLYSSLAARLVRGAHVVNALTGLGFVFSSSATRARLLRPVARFLLRFALQSSSETTIFQNREDLAMLTRAGIARPTQTALIRGSGVDVERFQPRHRTEEGSSRPVVALPSRLLREKGVYEFIAAVRLLRQRSSRARFVLVGEGDASNPGSVTEAELLGWQAEQLVELWGWSEDMAKVLSDVDVVVLPAYREGLPKSLLEAASCALPIVTTDTPGCNDVVVDGENGLLVQVGEVEGLADAIERLVADEELRCSLGRAGRERVLAHFSESIIVKQTLTVYRDLLAGSRPAPVAPEGAAVA